VSQMICLNFGVGLFSKETDGLISWVLHSFYGGLGLAQTEESHQRKGYATLVVQVHFLNHNNNCYRKIVTDHDVLLSTLTVSSIECWTGFSGMQSSAASVWASTLLATGSSPYTSC
jgi:hypothetical protein